MSYQSFDEGSTWLFGNSNNWVADDGYTTSKLNGMSKQLAQKIQQCQTLQNVTCLFFGGDINQSQW